MRQQNNKRDRYIQLVETFITAIESGRSGAELDDIRKEIRMLSTELNPSGNVDITPQNVQFSQVEQKINERDADVNRSIS